MKFADWDVRGFARPAAVEMVKNGVNPLLSVFFASRGIQNAGEVRRFLSDDLDLICDPFLLEGMDAAVDRIRAAYGDRAIVRGAFVHSGIDAIQGGVNDGHYLLMWGHAL